MASTAVTWFLPAGFVAIGSAMVAFPVYEPDNPTNASLPAGGTAALVHYVLIILGGLFVFLGLSAAVVLAMVL